MQVESCFDDGLERGFMKVTILNNGKKLINAGLTTGFLIATSVACLNTPSQLPIKAEVAEAAVLNENSNSHVPIAGTTVVQADAHKQAKKAVENIVIVNKVSYIRYVTDILNIRKEPNTKSDVLGKLVIGNEVTVVGEVKGSDFVKIKYNGESAYIHSDYLSKKKPIIKEEKEYTQKAASTASSWSGAKLTRRAGIVTGPSGHETYYNLPMQGVVNIMRSNGFSASEYPYWVREDGVKMLGPYVMVAADLSIRPRGSIVPTTLGSGIVADTGSFINWDSTRLDIATSW